MSTQFQLPGTMQRSGTQSPDALALALPMLAAPLWAPGYLVSWSAHRVQQGRWDMSGLDGVVPFVAGVALSILFLGLVLWKAPPKSRNGYLLVSFVLAAVLIYAGAKVEEAARNRRLQE